MPKNSRAPQIRAQRIRSGGREHLQALTRGLRAVAYLNRVGVCTNGALAKRLELKYSTAHRMLMVLADLGLVRHDPICHQFSLSRGVRELAAGFHDLPSIDEVAQPRMRAWTRRHGLPLLLVTGSPGGLIVRVATDGQRPVVQERHVAGTVLPARGSSEAAVMTAFSAANNQSAAASRVRRRGYARRVLQQLDEIHISVPVNLTQELTAILSIRCSQSMMAERNSVQRWAGALSELAAQIAAASI